MFLYVDNSANSVEKKLSSKPIENGQDVIMNDATTDASDVDMDNETSESQSQTQVNNSNNLNDKVDNNCVTEDGADETETTESHAEANNNIDETMKNEETNNKKETTNNNLENGELNEKIAESASEAKDSCINGETHDSNKTTNSTEDPNKPSTSTSESVPLLKGTLTYENNQLTRKHIIKGMWNFESSTENPSQPFILLRTLGVDEDPTELPKDGTFNGSFDVRTISVKHGKTKSKIRTISEHGVKLKFVKEEGGEPDSYGVSGQGTNGFGVFSIYGTAIKDATASQKQYIVELRKKYIVSSVPAVAESPKVKNKKRKLDEGSTTSIDNNVLPDPMKMYEKDVVCLRGKINKNSTAQDGVTHTVSGWWSGGLDKILADPKNESGTTNKFEYEYRGTVATETFPISGKYTGWFNLTMEDSSRTRIVERDVNFKFKKNNQGFYNVEGKGSNMFGKYTITGTLDNDNMITIFKHFEPAKVKTTKAPAPSVSAVETSPLSQIQDLNTGPRMTLDDVKLEEKDSYEPCKPLLEGEYAALSRGIMRVGDDGNHTCTGKWAITKGQFSSNMTSNFHFGLEEHHVAGQEFPVDSAEYKGSFKMRKGTAKMQSIVDQQLVIKFRKNTAGSFNVYGKGVNEFGTFDLMGTLIMQGKNSGHVELYRVYQLGPSEPQAQTHRKSLPTNRSLPTKGNALFPSPPSHQGLIRRESSRDSKLPSYLEDDDPDTMKSRAMDKCRDILSVLREKDLATGGIFAAPVDPVALGIPTYFQVISNPMDLGTIQAKMNANDISSPGEFAHLVRLVFDNAIKFNSDPASIVHIGARNMLSLFNSKFRDVERLLDKKRPSKKDKKRQYEEQKRLEKERKRKREQEEDPQLYQIRQMQMASADVASTLQTMSATAATGMSVTRSEFNLLSTAVRQMNSQLVHMQNLVISSIRPSALKSPMASATHQDAPSFATMSFDGGFDLASTSSSIKKTKRKKSKSDKTSSAQAPPKVHVPESPLTLEEQQELTEAINAMSQENLEGIIEIIRESADLNEDDEEIDLEIDQLDTYTQRKLQKFVMKTKPKKARKQQLKKTSSQAYTSASARSTPAASKAASNENFFAAFGAQGDESDSDEEIMAKNTESTGFVLNETMEEDDEDAINGNLAANWNISARPADEEENGEEDGEEDDAWEMAKKKTATQKALDKERQAREEKMIAEAEEAKERNLLEAAERGKKLEEERKFKEAKEAALRQQKEKEEKERAEKAREEARKSLGTIQPTVDLEGQRDIMKEYEQSFYDKDLGGASPNSDFGF
jgi:hypothetical protein